MVDAVVAVAERSPMYRQRRLNTQLSIRELGERLDHLPGETLQDRWNTFEWRVWPQWLLGIGRAPDHRWSLGVSTLVSVQAVRPTWSFLECTYTRKWVRRMPDDAPLQRAAVRLAPALEAVSWSTIARRDKALKTALKTALRILMVAGHTDLDQIGDEDLRAVPATVSSGSDVLDAALCSLGVLDRTPLPGSARRMRSRRPIPAELAERSRIPERFRAVHELYLEHYQLRISDVYATTRHKHNSLEHFWCFIDERYPGVTGCAEIRPAQFGRLSRRRSSSPAVCSAARPPGSAMTARPRCSG